jgi:phosphoglycolate phosphatase
VRLFLFDVDGTLVTARGAGRAAIGRALEATFGIAGALDAYDFRGKTDPRIVWDLMREAGVPDADIAGGIEACFAAYVRELEALIGDGVRVQVMPGIGAVVRALAARDDALVGLLTGNIEAGARVKLSPTGLLPLFRVGAFGSDDIDRRRLPAIACERARAIAGLAFSFDRVTIIGDTPLDVDCARACGAVAVAVATGQHAAHELSACGPDLLFPDFSDVEATVAALLAPAR